MKKRVRWKEVEDYIDNLINEMKNQGKFVNCSGVFTFPRGGYVLSTLFSYRANKPILTHPVKDCVIIDDICDSGITLKKYSDSKDKNNYFISTMYVHKSQIEKEAKYNCEFDYYEYIKENDWIIFPWEEKDISEEKIIDENNSRKV